MSKQNDNPFGDPIEPVPNLDGPNPHKYETVRFRAQGGKIYNGIATGRLGTRLRIKYRIQSGEKRERWFAKSRIIEYPHALDGVPLFKNRTCKAVKFETPIVSVKRQISEYTSINEYPDAPTECPGCGKEIGHHDAAAKLETELVLVGTTIPTRPIWDAIYDEVEAELGHRYCKQAQEKFEARHPEGEHYVAIGIRSHKEIVPA